MEFLHALRLDAPVVSSQTVSLVGAGGKTTALFQLARELIGVNRRVFLTSTTHLGVWQIPLADHHIIVTSTKDLNKIPEEGVILFTGSIEGERTKPLEDITINWLREKAKAEKIPLLIEADGARQKSLKAPDVHEPSIPEFSENIIVVAGLSAIGKPLTDKVAHRAEIFSKLSGLKTDSLITPHAIVNALIHNDGGQKNIAPTARRMALLNQADTPELQSLGGGMAKQLLDHFDSVIVGSLENKTLRVFEHTAGIILAAGESTRFGAPKQLLDWKGKPFVRHVAETALQAGLWPVVVVTGFHSTEVESCLNDLPINIVHNLEYKEGQSASIKAGVNFIQSSTINSIRGFQNVGSAIFLLADQPQIPAEVIRALVETHSQEVQPIIAPLVLEERRANPVLFDRVTFNDLMQLSGDVGGRGIFHKYKVEFMPWHDDILLFDVDKPEDYQRLVDIDIF